MSSMNHDRWQELEPLLDRALDLPPDERSRWLDELSGQSPALAAELTALLGDEAMADRSGFLGGPLDVSLAGLTLGPWRLERPLGQGGMGTVWLAARIDGRFEGRAAVKILNLALVSATGKERFRREGSVLARLDHAGIGRLLDAGVTATGQPYLVLEHVDGVAIDVFVRERGLDREARLHLFLQVLAAVGHAHANLIVHRDLKPSNILVTADGGVKLLDFGIAKLLDGDSAGGHSALTIDGGRVFTPRYAAPEQVCGEPLTTATDVYALGVLLYVLLAGRHPTAEGLSTPAEDVRALLEVEPARLGLGDLDTILAKAMRKAPVERYQTVGAFADDLGRYLRQEPVSARAHSLAYRGRKFVRRNRAAVTAALVLASGLVGATGFSLRQMREAQVQRDEARTQRDNARYQERRAAASSGFMEVLLQSIAPTDRAYTMQEMLDLAREQLESRYQGDPRFMARMMVELADHYFPLQDRRRELPLLSRAEELASRSSDFETAAFASCRLGKSAADDGDAEEAQRSLDRAKRYLARMDESPTGPRVQCLRTQSALARLQGRTAAALASAREAVALGVAAGDTTSILHMSALNEVARALHDDGQVRASLEVTRDMIDRLGRTNRDGTLTMLVEQYNEAALLSRLGEARAASTALARAVGTASGLNPERKLPTYMTVLAGELAGALGRPDSAISAFRHALADTRRSGNVVYQVRALAGLSDVLIDRGRWREAEPYAEELRRVAPAGWRWRADAVAARLMYAEGNVAEARRRYMDMLTSRGFPDRGLSTSYFASLVLEASIMALGSGDVSAAETLAGHALRLAGAEGQDAAKSGVVGYAMVLQARARQARGDLSSAHDELLRALTPLDSGYGRDNARTREARDLLETLSRSGANGAAGAALSASPAAPSAPKRRGARRSRRS